MDFLFVAQCFAVPGIKNNRFCSIQQSFFEKSLLSLLVVFENCIRNLKIGYLFTLERSIFSAQTKIDICTIIRMEAIQ